MQDKKSVKVLIVVSGIVLLGIGGYSYATMKAEDQVKASADKVVEAMTPYADVTYGNVSVSILKDRYVVSDLSYKIKPGITQVNGFSGYSADEVIVYGYDKDHEVPHFMHVEINGMSFEESKKIDKNTIEKMKSVGLYPLKLDAELDYKYDLKAKSFDSKLTYSLNGASVSLKVALVNVEIPDENMQSNPELAMGKAMQIALSRFEIRVTDKGLMDKLYNLASRETGKSKDNLIEEAASRLEKAASIAVTKGDTRAADAIVELKKFMVNSGELVVVIDPEKPLTFMEVVMVDPKALPGLLGASVYSQ